MTKSRVPVGVATNDAHSIKKVIRVQALRIALVYGLLAGLTVWQQHFIIGGIKSNPYLNAIIIGVFVFGSWLAIRSLFGLRNDINAFQALKEVYSDGHVSQKSEAEAQAARYARCLRPGLVYRSPELLGHVFDLTLEELLRSRHMRISIATMRNLMAAIDSRMAHQRSLIGYLTGLSVFLGLIGTFIGLMEMVGSVGGIIGGLASGDAGSPDSIKRLIHDLEAPLVGMATGFSCSLFGLFGSLMLGLIGRMSNTAAYAIKEEYESWLASISQIESGGQQELGEVSTSSARQPRLDDRSQAALVRAFGTSQDALENVLGEMQRIIARQDMQARMLENTCALMDRATQSDRLTLDAIDKLAHLHSSIDQMREDLARREETAAVRMMSGFERLAKLSREQSGETLQAVSLVGIAQEHADRILQRFARDHRVSDLVALTMENHATQIQVLDDLRTAHAQAAARIDAIAEAARPREDEGLLADAVVYAVQSGTGNLAGAMNDAINTLGHELARLATEQKRATELVMQQTKPDVLAEIRDLGTNIQTGINAGFHDIAGSLEVAFQAYARVLQVIGKAQQTAGDVPEPAVRRSV